MKDYNPFESREGRKLYERLFANRLKRLKISDTIHKVTDAYVTESGSLEKIARWHTKQYTDTRESARVR